jgi:cellobiose phosphorylase
MLGVRPTWDGLLIEPCIPRAWSGFTMTRRYRGCTYRIRVRGRTRRARVTLDGVELRRAVLPPCGAGCTHDVRVDLA